MDEIWLEGCSIVIEKARLPSSEAAELRLQSQEARARSKHYRFARLRAKEVGSLEGVGTLSDRMRQQVLALTAARFLRQGDDEVLTVARAPHLSIGRIYFGQKFAKARRAIDRPRTAEPGAQSI